MANHKSSNQIWSARSIHQFIEKQAFLNPDAPAIVYGGTILSYKELNEKSNQLANFLIEKGVKPETLVGILVERSIEMVIAVIGVLKAGGAYVPIDSDYPKKRIHYMLSESGIKILITHYSLLAKIPDLDIDKICLDTDYKKINVFSKNNPTVPINPTNLAYVLYTSGSTGNPKGVMVCHSNLIHAYYGWEEVYKLSNTDCHLQMANFAFDVFSGDFIRALCSGGKLVLSPRDILLIPEKLYKLMRDEKINCAEFVPTVLRRLIEYIELNGDSLKFMRLLICGSDNWSMHEYRKLQKLCGKETRVINSYGLTEATIDTTYFESELSSKEYFSLDHAVPIGKPFPKTEILLLDKTLNVVPVGEIGEIHIGGASLARGYFNQPELTAKKFILSPFTKKQGTKLYKTGDLGRSLPDGNIEFLGRIDFQVKLRGMRIELSDIENVLNCYHTVRESLVMLSEDESQHKRLIAYIVLENDVEPDVRKLRNFLQDRLPHYMIPSVFIRLDSLPMMPNGKLDRHALESKTVLMVNENHVAPRNSIESELASTWEKLLHINNPGIFDHFLDLGGDSFLLAQLICEVENTFFVKVPTCETLTTLTIANLARFINDAINTKRKDLVTSYTIQSKELA